MKKLLCSTIYYHFYFKGLIQKTIELYIILAKHLENVSITSIIFCVLPKKMR